MAFAWYRRQGDPAPPPTRMILYGLEAVQDLTVAVRDLQRTVRLLQSGFTTLFPDEASGLRLRYSVLDRDLMQVERTGQDITVQLLTALAETHEDIVQLAATNCPASRGVWRCMDQSTIFGTCRPRGTDKSGVLPVPLDAQPFRVVVRTAQITATLGGYIDPTALALPLSALVDLVFIMVGKCRPPLPLQPWMVSMEKPVHLFTTRTAVVPITRGFFLSLRSGYFLGNLHMFFI